MFKLDPVGKPCNYHHVQGKTAAGYYNWKIPQKQATGSDYKIRITSTTNSVYTDTSDNQFTIK
jgi:hypothetical protein